MTKKSGTTTASGSGRPVESGRAAAGSLAAARPRIPDSMPVTAPGAVGLAVVAVAWLAAVLWLAQLEISANAGTMAITVAALSLPGMIGPSLVAGAAAGLVLANLLTRRGVDRPTPRFATALAAGLVTGVLAALAITLTYRGGPAITVLAGTVAAAAIIGGAIGGLRPPVVGAIIIASLAVSALVRALAFFQHDLVSLYGAGETPQSQLSALTWVARTASLSGGLVAGLVAFGYLRWARRRAARRPAAQPLRWPAYLVAGAGPGLLLLVVEGIIRTAGARVLDLAGAVSEADRTAQGVLGGSRVNHALIVLFLGSITATIAFGRTLRPADDSPDPADDSVHPADPVEPAGVGGPGPADRGEPEALLPGAGGDLAAKPAGTATERTARTS